MSKVYRCYAEKKKGFDVEAQSLLKELREQLGLTGLEDVRILHRYDVEGIQEATYKAARAAVFGEPQVDTVYDEAFPVPAGTRPSVQDEGSASPLTTSLRVPSPPTTMKSFPPDSERLRAYFPASPVLSV